VLRTLVVIPTYNEAGTLERALVTLLGAEPSVHALIVDDGSPDGTGGIAHQLAAADPRVHVLHRAEKSGLGSAYRAGFRWGLNRRYDVVCEMDADLSHDPRDVPRLLAALQQADLVIGSRYVAGGAVTNWPRRRLLLSRGGNTYVQAVTGLPVADATSGFRAYRSDVLRSVDAAASRSQGYAFQIELALKAWQAGFRIQEVPILFTERVQGVSKMSNRIVVEAVLRTALWGVVGLRTRVAGRSSSTLTQTRVGSA
jgi:glycosyltransferase involved in cell wall biosynthesis